MSKDNYTAWDVLINPNFNSLSEEGKLKHLSEFALLAPSVHNTQPWKLRFKQNILIISPNKDRVLVHSGKKVGEPYFSIGCFLGVLTEAARGYGTSLIVVVNDTNNIRISINNEMKKDNHKLLKAITNRNSNRNKFRKVPVDKSLTKEISTLDDKNIGIKIVSSEEDIKFIADQTEIATYRSMSTTEFREELSSWVRNNHTRKYDGMPGRVQGIPTPPSYFAKHIIKHLNIGKTQAKKDSMLVENSGNIIIITARDKSPRTFIDAGRAYSHIGIYSQLHKYASSGVIAATTDAETRERVIKRFSLAYKPVAIVRIGIPTKHGHKSPRYTLKQVQY